MTRVRITAKGARRRAQLSVEAATRYPGLQVLFAHHSATEVTDEATALDKKLLDPVYRLLQVVSTKLCDFRQYTIVSSDALQAGLVYTATQWHTALVNHRAQPASAPAWLNLRVPGLSAAVLGTHAAGHPDGQAAPAPHAERGSG